MSKPKRPRVDRRERDARRLVRDRQRLALLEPGGSADRPIEVVSSSVIEVRARSLPCPLCAGALRIDDHAATKVAGVALRALDVTCQRCGVARTLWFRIVGLPMPS